MADGTLMFDTKIDETGLNKGLSGASKTASKGGSLIGNAFSAGLGVLTGNLMTKATDAIVEFGKESIQTGMEFEAAMSQIAATKGFSVDELRDSTSEASQTMEVLKEKAQEMGRTTAFTATEAAEALNILAMSGFSTEESIAMVDDVLNLSAAGAMDMGNAASYVSGIMKGFNDETKDSTYYVDLIAKGATLANTNVEQLGAALSSSAATVTAYGQSADSVTVALLRLAEQNLTGAEAGTALNRVMADLFTPTDKAAQALEQLGIQTYDSTGKARDINDVIADLNDALSGMSDEEANAYKNMIFTTLGLRAYNDLVATGTDKTAEFKEELNESAGSAANQAQTQLDNLQGSVTLFNSALDGLKVAIYDKIKEPLRMVVDAGTELLGLVTKVFEVDWVKLGKDIISAIVEGLKDLAQDVLDFFNDLWDLVLTNADETPWAQSGEHSMEEIALGMARENTNVSNTAIDIMWLAHRSATEQADEFESVGSDAANKVSSGFSDESSTIEASAIEGIQAAYESASTEAEGFEDIGEYMADGISDGLDASSYSLAESAVSMVATAWDAMCDWLDIASPSKKAKKWIGGNWAKGIGIGFEDEMDEQTNDMTGSIADAFNSMAGAVNDLESGSIAGGMVSNISRSTKSSVIDYDALAQVLINAMKSVSVNIDGQRAGNILTDYIDANLGDAYALHEGGIL